MLSSLLKSLAFFYMSVIFSSCQNSNKEVTHRVTISDSLLLPKESIRNNRYSTFYNKASNESYMVYVSSGKNRIYFVNLTHPRPLDSIEIESAVKPKYGYEGIFVKNKDSIFILPGETHITNLLYLFNNKGEKISSWELKSEDYPDQEFAISEGFNNKISVNQNKFFCNRFMQGIGTNKIGRMTNPYFYTPPHEVVLDLKTGSTSYCGIYPDKIKSNELIWSYALKTFKGDSIYWLYSTIPVVNFSYEKDNFTSIHSINIGNHLNFETQEATRLSEVENYSLTDDMLCLHYDNFKKYFYVFYAKNVASQNDGFTVTGYEDKLKYLAVFDEEFNFIFKTILPKSKVNVNNVFITEKGIYLEATQKYSDQKKNKYYLINVTKI